MPVEGTADESRLVVQPTLVDVHLAAENAPGEVGGPGLLDGLGNGRTQVHDVEDGSDGLAGLLPDDALVSSKSRVVLDPGDLGQAAGSGVGGYRLCALQVALRLETENLRIRIGGPDHGVCTVQQLWRVEDAGRVSVDRIMHRHRHLRAPRLLPRAG